MGRGGGDTQEAKCNAAEVLMVLAGRQTRITVGPARTDALASGVGRPLMLPENIVLILCVIREPSGYGEKRSGTLIMNSGGIDERKAEISSYTH